MDVKFSGNLIGVVGKNGCGKTNLLNAIRFAFTGEPGDPSDTKESVITLGESKGDVELWFEAHGKEGYIKRALHSNTRKFQYGDSKLTKDAEISMALQELFGMDKDMLKNLTFIRQGELQKLLFGDRAEREANFLKIFGLGQTEAIRTTLLAKIDLLKTQVVDVGPMLDEHRKTLEVEMAKLPEIQAAADKSNQAREDWAVATRTLEGIRDLTDKFVNKGKLRYELDRIDKEILGLEAKDGATASIRISKQDELKELERQRSVYDTQLGQFRARKDAREELATVQNYVRETFASYFSKNAELQAIPVAESVNVLTNLLALATKAVETKAVLASAVDNLSTVQAEGTKLDHKIDAASVEQVRIKDLVERYIVDRSNIQANLNQLSEAWSKLKDLNAACPCPVCKSMITDVAGLKASTSALMAAAQASYDKLSGEISKATNDERIKGKELSELTVQRQTNLVQQGISKKQKQEAEAWLSGYAGVESVEALSNRLVQAQKAAALTPEVALLNSRLEGYKSKEALLLKTLQEYSDLPEVIASLDSDRMAAVRSWLKDSDNVLSQISALKGSRSTFQVQLDELDKTLVGLTPPTLELTKATEDVVIALQTVWETAKEAVGRLDMLKATIQGLKIKIAQLEDQRGQCGKVTELIQRFEKIREVLERRNFPLTFVQQYFVRLMPRIQHHLAASGADFVVRQSAEDPVSFVFDKLDGSCLGLTVDKLSGGQKVRLVVAFLFALHEYMSAKMGFLVLDEPTVFLDDTGVESFGELLSDIVVRLKNSDMQVLISTHEQGLKSQFTSSIQLGNAV